MTVSSTTNRVSYTGDGVTTAFAFSYPFQSQSDLKVILVLISTGAETVQTITTHYTISGTTTSGVYASGGTVNMVTAPSSSYKLVIYRDPALTQTVDLVENDALPAETLEQGLDKAMLVAQRTRELTDRAVVLPDGFTGTFDPTLPANIATAKGVVTVNSDGDGFEIGTTTTAIANAETNATAAAASATLASQWASLTSGQVASTDYSAKAWAIGGTGVSDTASRGASKEWAIETSGTVDGTSYSAKEHAVGTQTRGASGGGSAKDWANYTSGTVDDTEYSAKYYANAAATSASDAATYAAASAWNDVSYKTNADSPITISDSDAGTLFSIDCTSGNVTVNLPAISGLSLTGPWVVGFKKTDSSSNTITINRNGTDTIDGATSKTISRQYAGCNLIPDTDASPDDWTALSFGEVPITGAIVGTTDTQTLTNKTFDDAITIQEISTPSTPASGYGKTYFKSDGKLYFLDDTGAETQVGAGAGGINYASSNPDAESAVTGYTAYADAAATSPVDMTGGSPTVTITRNTSSALRGNGDFLITKDAANRQGEGVSFDFTIANADKYKPIYVSFEYLASANYVDDDVRIYIYDVTNTTIIEPVGRDLKANTNGGKHYAYFQATDSTSYRVGFHVASTNASAYTIQYDTFTVSPTTIQSGAFVSDWKSFTPTGSHSTNATYTGFYRRVGDTLEMKARVSYAGATNVSTALTFNLPSGLTIDTAKLTSTSDQETYLGLARISDASVNEYEGVISYSSTTSLKVRVFVEGAATALTATNFTSASPFTIASGDSVSIQAWGIPIVGWGNSVELVSQRTNRVIAARMIKTSGQAVASTSATKVTFTSVASSNYGFDTAGAADTTNSLWTCPESGTYMVRACLAVSATDAGTGVIAQIHKNGALALRSDAAPGSAASNQAFAGGLMQLVKGDYLEVYVQSKGGDSSYTVAGNTGADENSYFEIHKLQGNQTIGMDEVVAASYETNAGQSISDNSATVVLFEDKIVDTHGSYNTSTGSYTIPVSGTYLVKVRIAFAGSSAWSIGEVARASLLVNGSTSVAESLFELPATSASTIVVTSGECSYIGSFNKGDTIAGRAFQNSGGAITLNTSSQRNQFFICKLK